MLQTIFLYFCFLHFLGISSFCLNSVDKTGGRPPRLFLSPPFPDVPAGPHEASADRQPGVHAAPEADQHLPAFRADAEFPEVHRIGHQFAASTTILASGGSCVSSEENAEMTWSSPLSVPTSSLNRSSRLFSLRLRLSSLTMDATFVASCTASPPVPLASWYSARSQVSRDVSVPDLISWTMSGLFCSTHVLRSSAFAASLAMTASSWSPYRSSPSEPSMRS